MLYQQPQIGPIQVDQSNPLSASLVQSLILGARNPDFVTGKLPAVIGTKKVITPAGLASGFGAIYGTGSTDRIATGLATGLVSRSYYARIFRNGAGGGSFGRIFDKTSGASGQYLFWYDGVTAINYGYYASSGTEINVSIPGSSAVEKWIDVLVTHAYSVSSSVVNAYINGVRVLTNDTRAGALTDAASTALSIGNRADGVRSWDGAIEVFHAWDRIVSPSEAAELARNRYQIYADPDDDDEAAFFAVAGSAGIVLASSTSSATASSAALGTQIALTSSALSGTGAASTLTTQVALAVPTTTATSASAQLATVVVLESNADTASTASASLATGAAWSSSAISSTSAASTLNTQVALAAASGVATLSAAQLATAIALASSAYAPASASAAMAAGPAWAASATSRTSATSTLATAVSMATAAQSACTPAAALTMAVVLVAAAVSSTSAAASLATQAMLAAIATAAMSSSALLATRIALSSASANRTSGSATLAGELLALPDSRLYRGPGENRIVRALADHRIYLERV